MTERPGIPVVLYADFYYEKPIDVYDVDHNKITVGPDQRLWLDAITFNMAQQANSGDYAIPAVFLMANSAYTQVYFYFIGPITADDTLAPPSNIFITFPPPGFPLQAGDHPGIRNPRQVGEQYWGFTGLGRIRPATEG